MGRTSSVGPKSVFGAFARPARATGAPREARMHFGRSLPLRGNPKSRSRAPRRGRRCRGAAASGWPARTRCRRRGRLSPRGSRKNATAFGRYVSEPRARSSSQRMSRDTPPGASPGKTYAPRPCLRAARGVTIQPSRGRDWTLVRAPEGFVCHASIQALAHWSPPRPRRRSCIRRRMLFDAVRRQGRWALP
jgi:hypothetical protein